MKLMRRSGGHSSSSDDDEGPIDEDDQRALVDALSARNTRGSNALCGALSAACLLLALAKVYWGFFASSSSSPGGVCADHPHARLSWRAPWLPAALELCSAALFALTAFGVWTRAQRTLLWNLFAAALFCCVALLAGASIASAAWLAGFNVAAALLTLWALSAVAASDAAVATLRGATYRFKAA